ncbi:MAG: TetR/AcrR family transcriptional regulator [Sphingomonadales bacterium]|nr:TetR/AcrR family transcriptional regulator [Sphingomonadales bacterium]MDE2171053.1 TetR/AcrR family transcriptional regulator [Sphingomonadales bacterium]
MTEKLSHKERTRARILDEAAKAMRAHGFDGVSVATVMKAAGLTHGGFYAHFANRDDLVTHTIDRMFDDNRTMLARHLEQDDKAAGLIAYIDDYLSEERIGWRTRGCALTAMMSEAVRMPPEARAVFAAGMERYRNRLRDALIAIGHPNAEEEATSALSEMVGAATMARAFGEGDMASAILRTARAQVKQRLGLTVG